MREVLQTDSADLQKHVRGFVNERRKELGLRATGKLSKAYLGIGPVAQSLEAVGVIQAGYDGDDVILIGRDKHGTLRQRVWTDPIVAQFMRAFDAGDVPELLIVPKPIKIGGEVVGQG